MSVLGVALQMGRHEAQARKGQLHLLLLQAQDLGDHEVEEDAQCPDVHVTTHVAFLFEELWSGVGCGTTECGEDLGWTSHYAEAKVSHLDAVAGGIEDILCFHVSVDNVVVVLE